MGKERVGLFWLVQGPLAALKDSLLQPNSIIQPGQTVEKVFWLKNSEDQVNIDFDAIKMVK